VINKQILNKSIRRILHQLMPKILPELKY